MADAPCEERWRERSRAPGFGEYIAPRVVERAWNDGYSCIKLEPIDHRGVFWCYYNAITGDCPRNTSALARTPRAFGL